MKSLFDKNGWALVKGGSGQTPFRTMANLTT